MPLYTTIIDCDCFTRFICIFLKSIFVALSSVILQKLFLYVKIGLPFRQGYILISCVQNIFFNFGFLRLQQLSRAIGDCHTIIQDGKFISKMFPHD